MRISDWSSDVCSSDLTVTQGADGDPLYVRMTTDGRLRPGVELRIVDDDGNDVETGTEGEVATRGPDMFLGYSDPAIDAGAWLPGCWFLSGDIRSEEHTSELQSLMRTSYAVFCLKKKRNTK